MKRFFSLLLTILLLFPLASCSGNSGGSFAYPLSISPSTLDPQYAGTSSAETIINSCFEGLVRIGSDGSIVPGVAESWTVSEDGTQYLFSLRHDAEWCMLEKLNGKKTIGESWEQFDTSVMAYDFVFAFTRAVSPETQCPDYRQFMVIKNASAVHSGKKPVSSMGIKAVDDYNLMIILEHACPDFLQRLAGTAFMPCNEEFFTTCAGRYGLSPQYLLCNGPFYVAAWDSSTALTARKNKQYSGNSKVEPSTVTFYFNNDSADVAKKVSLGTYSAALFTDVDSVPAEGVNVNYIDNSVYGFCFNCDDEAFHNEYLRIALSMCIKPIDFKLPDGSAFCKTCVPQCCTAGSVRYAGQVSRQMPTINYDEEKAMEYWKAGLEVISKKSLSVTLLCEEKFADILRTQIQAWQKVFGVDLSVAFEFDTENNIETRLKRGEYRIAFAPVHSSTVAAVQYLADYMPGSTGDIFNLKDEDYEKIIYSALDIDNQQDALNGAFTADSYLIKHAVFYPVFTGKTAFVTSSSVSGIEYSASGNNINFMNALSSD